MKTLLAACLAAALALSTASCSDPDPKTLISDGRTALGKGDAKGALDDFQKALKVLKPGDPQFVEAKMGEVEALIAIDAKKSRDEFLALAKGFPDQVTQQQFSYVSGQLANGKRYDEAIDVAHAGKTRFGAEATKLTELIDKIKKEAQASGDAALVAKLKSLGYL
jgi:hypothetical protein